MDMSGAMPDRAWLEIRDPEGGLIETVQAKISGGGVQARLPAFPEGTLGTIRLCTQGADGQVHREDAELGELPTEELLYVCQIG